MAIQLSDPSVTINNEAINVVPNSVSYNDGFGTQTVLVQSAGNGKTSTVYSNNVETNIGSMKFSIRSTPANANYARTLKASLNANVVMISGTTPDGKSLTRTMTEAAFCNDLEVPLNQDGVISVEMMGNKTTL